MSSFQEVEEDIVDDIHSEKIDLSENVSDDQAANDDDITSSFENIVPPQVKKGFGMFFNWATTTATIVKDKAVEINNSDTVQVMKARTAAAVHQAGEVAAPLWEKTKESLSAAAEITTEQASLAAENLQPTFEAVSNRMNDTLFVSFLRIIWHRFPHSSPKQHLQAGIHFHVLLPNGWTWKNLAKKKMMTLVVIWDYLTTIIQMK